MTQFKLPTTAGVSHLPNPSGGHSVGFVDVFTPAKNGSLSGLLFRLYYPTSVDSTSAETVPCWGHWFPLPQYADGYLRYKFSSLGPLVPLLGRLFVWLTGNPSYPAAEGASYLRDISPRPVVVFSHGLAACRTTYSFLCTDLASKGYFVAALEHGDGSACLRSLKQRADSEIELKYQELVEKDTPEYELRNNQVKFRAKEVSYTLDILDQMNKGELDNAWLQNMTETEIETFRTHIKGGINLDQAAVCGHSFGGATTTLSMATDQRLKAGVALDSWMFPIREEKLNYTSPGNLLFINCEKFQGVNNLTTMKTYEGSLDNEIESNVVTVTNATHYAPTDIPIIMEGSSASSLFHMIGGGQTTDGLYNWDTLQLFSDLCHSWLQKCLGFENTFAQKVEKKKDILVYGIDI